jgi:hypothetical protein
MSWQEAAVSKLKPARVGGLFMEMGTGKALPLDAVVLTPRGFIEMGKIHKGDLVIGSNGKATEVIGVYPQGIKDVFEITFSDGGKAQCTEDHLWKVITPLRKWRGMPPKIMTLSELLKSGLKHSNGNRKYQIPIIEPVEFKQLGELPIDPYLLGVLLGDGHLRSRGGPSFTTIDDGILNEVSSRLPSNMRIARHNRLTYNLCGIFHGKNQLMDSIRKLGLAGTHSDTKFIPKEYLMASVEARKLLLQGLMDTDGNKDAVGCEFVTISKQLADDMKFLVLSLGGLVNTTLKNPVFTHNGEKRNGKLAYRLHIRFQNTIQPFKLKRKLVEKRTKYHLTRSMESVGYIGKKLTQCISVLAEDGLFITNDFVVTHNTRTAIELVKTRVHKIDKVVWFCPISLKPTVRLEILKHTNCMDVYVFDDSTTSQNIPKNARWIIIGIESLSSSNRTVFATNSIITDKTFVILDESSYIKGHKAKRTERVILIAEKAKYRFVLTGTPISQGVEDLFSQMKFLSPQILGYRSWYTFSNNHLEYSERHPGLIVRAHNTKYLAEKMAPYVYQVTKEECMKLPGKHYKMKSFSITREQQKYYDLAKDEILLLIDVLDDFKPYTIFRLFGVLQQIASGFWNRRICKYPMQLSEEDTFKFLTFSDNRLPMLFNIISQIPVEDKIIIWAKFRYDIDRIVSELHECYGPDSVAVFTGSTPQKQRQSEVEEFRGPARFFVSTQSCGGHGLTLNEAKHVIFFSNSFKYSERLQAEDRCHRFGLDHEVTYWDIIGPGIDERIWESLSRKENVADSFKREVDAIKDDRAKLKDLIKLL